jgi:hypothetical protein
LYGGWLNNQFEKIKRFLTRRKKIFKNSCLSCKFLGYLLEELAESNCMAVSKKRVIKSLENLSNDLRDLLKDQYPNGYESSITRITNAKKEPIFVFPLETDDATYLIKVPATKNSEGEYDVESKPEVEFSNAGNDDDFGTSSDDDGYNATAAGGDDDDYDKDDEGKSREASYDPDFDG